MIPVMDVEGNHRLDWFFRQYVYGADYAHYAFSRTVQQVNRKWDVTGNVTRSGVPDGWVDVMPFYGHFSGRAIPLGWLHVNKNTQTFDVTLPMKPDKVTMNDDDEILAVVKQ